MKALALVAALMVAGPAFVPPALPPSAAGTLAQAFIRATESNDVSAYASLFAPDAKIRPKQEPL